MEDISTVPDAVLRFVKENLLMVVIFTLGLMLLASGLILFRDNNKAQIVLEREKSTEAENLENKEIVVDVGGAVINPNVYKLKSSDRIQDALIAAGGLSDEADREYVQKKVNLAQKLSDGVKIYIPRVSESKAVLSQTGILASESLLININSSSISELDTLSGIGPVTAQKIIDGRPYGSVEELLERKIVSSSVFEKIRDRIIY